MERRTALGRHMKAIGAGESAALASGVKVIKVKIITFAIAGAFSAAAGVLLATRLSGASPTMADQFLLPAIVAVLLGGTPLTGGVGGVLSTLIGTLIVAVIRTSMTYLNVEAQLHASAKNIKRLGLELGGKNPQVVFADADIDAALDGTLFGFLFNTGQCCVSGSRLLVERSIHKDFCQKLVERAQKVRSGDPLNENTQIGAIITEKHYQTVLGYIEQGKNEGATLLTGGNAVPAGNGLFIEPTIFDDVTPEMTIFREEIFGPRPIFAASICRDRRRKAIKIWKTTSASLRAPAITRWAPAKWASTRCRWSIPNCAFAVLKGCAWWTRR